MRACSIGILFTVVLVGAACALVMGTTAIVVAVTDHPLGYFSRDPAATLGASPFVGLLSHIVILIAWGGAVASGLAAVLVARPTSWRHASPLLAAALGTAYLALDDLLQFHEELYPTHLGIPQRSILVAYVVLTVVYLWCFRSVIRRHEWPLLAVALGVLAASVALDQFGDAVVSGTPRLYLEESTKLLGFSLLAAYLVRLGMGMHAEAYPRARSPRVADAGGSVALAEDAAAGRDAVRT